MIQQLWILSVHTRAFLRRYMPTNILLDAIRTRRGLKWGVPAMLLAVPCLLAASTFTALIADGGPDWLNLLVLLCMWNTMKFVVMGPVSLVLLACVRMQEAVAARAERRATTELVKQEKVALLGRAVWFPTLQSSRFPDRRATICVSESAGTVETEMKKI